MVDSHEIEEEVEDEALVWSVVADAWDLVDTSMDPSKVTEALDRLPTATADLLAVDWCQKEVRNGGFEQFLANSTGVLAPRALLGFERIGGGHFANLLRSAMGTLGEPYPLDHDTREEAVSLLPTEILDEALDGLDDQFFALLNDPERGLSRLAAAYIRGNPDLFPPPQGQGA